MRPHHHRRRRLGLLLAAVTALAVAGCSVESGGDAATPSSSPSLLPAPLAPAISPGVTADTIKLGLVYPDLSKVKQFVHIDHGDYKAAFQALVDKINKGGGINGRKIVPVYGAVDVLSPTGAQDTCVHLIEDEKVFAVVGNLNTNEPMCYVQTHKTALVGGSLTTESYAKAQAPWFSDLRGGDEVGDGLKLFRGDLVGRKVAVVTYVGDKAVLDDTVLPGLRSMGVTPVQSGVLDAPLTDPAAVAQQTGVFVQKFQSAGVDTVLVVGGISTQFPAQLEKTDYRPRLLFTDVSQARAYSFDAGAHDFSTLRGAVALGLGTDFAEPANQECVHTVEAAVPGLKIVDPDTVPPGEPAPGVSVSVACRYLALFTAIADKAGRDLTYQSFQRAGFALGSFQIPFYTDRATYSQNTPHGAIPDRRFEYDPAKKNFALVR
ncbi:MULTISPECIES: ABC transporter substrate-binding protein [Pseudofrankia]|uniref:ABC transporter substrate-binding protein n=1 Tax=Pseudofrankia TaxID=2994363 RepID=UPI000234C792|nr:MULTISPECIES: ABC transporter substrate-binding protein [Pseudofrankia]OHV29158.1 hypothetical protein BCD49_36375 [Pseudofrankia sp. EUN1h]